MSAFGMYPSDYVAYKEHQNGIKSLERYVTFCLFKMNFYDRYSDLHLAPN